MPLFQKTSPALKNSWSRAYTQFYICLDNNSNDFARASAGGVINVTRVLKHSSLVARGGGTERTVANPYTTHLTSLRYS